jgi:hypothetical protein
MAFQSSLPPEILFATVSNTVLRKAARFLGGSPRTMLALIHHLGRRVITLPRRRPFEERPPPNAVEGLQVVRVAIGSSPSRRTRLATPSDRPKSNLICSGYS